MITEKNLIDNGWTKINNDFYKKGQYEFYLEDQHLWDTKHKRSGYHWDSIEQLNSYCD